MSVTNRAVRSTIAILAVIGLAACGSDVATDAASTEPAATGGGAIEVSGAWARTSPAAASNGAAYMVITASDADRLVSASVDPSVAGTVEIHEMVAAEGTTDDSMAMTDDSMAMTDDSMAMTDDSMAMGDQPMTMRELAGGLELPAGKAVTLAPGGYHVMLIDLDQPLEVGTSFDLDLTFEHADPQTVKVEVRDDAP